MFPCVSIEWLESLWGHIIEWLMKDIDVEQHIVKVAVTAVDVCLQWTTEWTALLWTGIQRCACIAACFSSLCLSSCSASTRTAGGRRVWITSWYLSLIHAITSITSNCSRYWQRIACCVTEMKQEAELTSTFTFTLLMIVWHWAYWTVDKIESERENSYAMLCFNKIWTSTHLNDIDSFYITLYCLQYVLTAHIPSNSMYLLWTNYLGISCYISLKYVAISGGLRGRRASAVNVLLISESGTVLWRRHRWLQRHINHYNYLSLHSCTFWSC